MGSDDIMQRERIVREAESSSSTLSGPVGKKAWEMLHTTFPWWGFPMHRGPLNALTSPTFSNDVCLRSFDLGFSQGI